MGDCSIFDIPEDDVPTFTPVPPDDNLLFPEWLDWHLEKSADHSFLVLVGDDTEENITLTWGEVLRASFRLSAKLRGDIEVDDEDRKKGVKIGILCNTDGLTYCTIVLAIIRAGFLPCPLSIRNSVPALEHLIQKTGCRYLFGNVAEFGTSPNSLHETTAEVMGLIPGLRLLEVPTYTQLYPRLMNPVEPYNSKDDATRTPFLDPVRSYPEYTNVTRDSELLYLHSSGSTSFPKPIPFSHKYWNSVCRSMSIGASQTVGSRWGLMGLPVFHGLGVVVTLGAPAAGGAISLMFKPSGSGSPVIPTSNTVLAACQRGKADLLMAVPTFFVDWSQDEEAVEYLATLKASMYCGGPLPVETGDQLVEAGVKVINLYGSTEVGLIFKLGVEGFNPDSWNYGELYPTMQADLIPEGNGLYRLVVVDCEEHPIAVSNQSQTKAFDTNDLLEQHPTRKNYWRVIGRGDDQLMMSNGEKTNPGPMESIINGNPHVQAAIMFGRGRAQVGIAVEPAEHVHVTTDMELADFRNLIWSDVEKANAFAPQHSRIFKEFILVIDQEKKPFARTPKQTVSRSLVLKQYTEEIDALYSAAEVPTRAAWAEPPSSWSDVDLQAFVGRVVTGVMRGSRKKGPLIDEARDLFEQGCDSLQATYIRAAIMNALRQAPQPEGKSDIAATSVPQNLVFSYPTVKRLTAYMTKSVLAAATRTLGEADDASLVIKQMQTMAAKYTQDFPGRMPLDGVACGEVVLLTGSTGTLGSYLLQQLLLDERVDRVYAVNRCSLTDVLLDRQRAAFLDRGVDVRLLGSPKLHLVEADLTARNLGLDDALSQEICQHLTTIIHTAWRLDFNLALSSFESNVRSSRALVDLALRSQKARPAQLIFTSSIGTVMKWTKPRPVPEKPLADPMIATANGYAESKWVTEQVLIAAAQECGLRATIWRVGQLAGSRQNGAWNTTNWLPLLVKSGESLKILPKLSGCISWLPTDEAAQSIIDVMHYTATKPGNECQYLNLVHPDPIAWDQVLGIVAQKMDCKLVPFSKWVNRLEEAAEDPTEVEGNPAIKLLDFYRSAAVASATRERQDSASYKPKEAMGLPDLETGKAEECSLVLKDMKCLGAEDVEKWMEYWTKQGLFAGKALVDNSGL
ncbi:acetyl-CoA synthetase-like protein [Calocera viscosa TUFC12733]|uniref:Acetyl-CoA synthetase-like protein n=1 Tax=Calocera viscosa (strain TUFC12733) TaxID=1330018 RepID=A0A167JSM5_CALVF|nr:acetyl-CoA synthetase-like protein [Calocera viscosa TUFC12733]